MATKKAVGQLADHTKYHLAPKGDAVVVNPEISSGIPIATLNRYPQPASRPEIYSTPATKASDPAQNPYWKRDVRRQYPQLSVVTQEHLGRVLLGVPVAPAVSAPSEGKSSVPAETSTAPVELTEAIAKLGGSGKSFSPSNLPPAPPFKKWAPSKQEDAPHNPTAYWPMSLYGGNL
ncbi:NADH ubiquinone oxidoreductase [Ceratobasidium theobromae]|uniref:NADH ubiquinone oxidoreductase n=1 Tax=Ceratobasidium theobromae TaxID=1582974 RepID=A0A5N5QG93_9AGAM|nr:NADH ubiquinone oxidoreductase [Ceratobasidium theobromae]